MTLEQQCILSYYKEVAVLNEKSGVMLVQHTVSARLYVKKTMAVYNKDIYFYLKEHPVKNTPEIYEVIEDNGIITVIEEYIHGRTVEQVLAEDGIFSEEDTINYIIQLSGILSDLHGTELKIVHRDIKPSNIIISSGVLYLLDMNAAKFYSDGARRDTYLLGTAGYAAPEQYGFGSSDKRTDIYAVGVVMNEMLTGDIAGHYNGSAALRDIISKCTRLDPEDRFVSAEELALALKQIHGFGPKSEEKSDRKARWYIPAGFRTGRGVFMVISVVIYLFIILMAMSITVEGAGTAELWLNRVFFFLIPFIMINFSCYMFTYWVTYKKGKVRSAWLRILIVIIVNFLIFLTLMLLMAAIETLIR